LRHTLLAPWQW